MSAETPNDHPEPGGTEWDLTDDSGPGLKDKLSATGDALMHNAQAAADRAGDLARRASETMKHKASEAEADAQAFLDGDREPEPQLPLKALSAAVAGAVAVVAAVWLWRRLRGREDADD